MLQSEHVYLSRLHKTVNDELKKALPSNPNVSFTGNADTIVLSGKASTPEESKRAEAVASAFTKKVVNLIEVPDPRQIQLQVKFASVDRGALNNFGINLVSRNPNTIGTTSTQQFQGPLFSQLQFQNEELQTTNLNISNLLNLFLFRPDLNIGATIQALQNRNLMQILAEPNLIVTEGKEASFLAGGEFPYPTVTSTPTQGGIAPVVTVQFKKFGVQLDFTPQAAANGAIRLKVKPEVSSLDFNNAVSVQAVLIPAVSTRYAETEVVLKDGESFAIAGLIDNRVTQVLNRIRGFGDIPVLGHLFRSRATNKSTDELMVVITPHVILPRPPGDVVKLPETTIEFQPKAQNKKAEQQSKKDAKKTKDGKQAAKPEFSGDRGHEVPQ